MPDTKITALTAIGANPIIPSTFPIPMVDLTDTSMAASGTTKKVTVNQILGAGGTATLASATITGDLTVDTSTLKVDSANNRVGVGTASPLVPLHVETTGTSTSAFGNVVATFRSQAAGRDSTLQFSDGTNQAVISMLSGALSFGTAGSNTRYQIDGTGVSTWSVAGTTAMTLNSTGLGVKGTIGTSSGDSVIAFGARGVIVGNTGSAIASGSYIDIAVITNGQGYQGFLSVANTLDANANARTQTTFSVFGRGASSTITQIATADGSTSGASFTVTTPSAGVIRITNTAGSNSTIVVQFFGATSG